MTQPLFITGNGTEVGKTFVTVALVAALRERSVSVVALKPIETGCDPQPLDALALADACERPEVAQDPRFIREKPPLAPYAIARDRPDSTLDLGRLARAVEELGSGSDVCLVEGAGGLLVPLSKRHTNADLARVINGKLVIVARNRLGVLSDTIAVVEAARRRQLPIAAVYLNTIPDDPSDLSQKSNLAVLSEVLALDVVEDDEALLKIVVPRT